MSTVTGTFKSTADLLGEVLAFESERARERERDSKYRQTDRHRGTETETEKRRKKKRGGRSLHHVTLYAGLLTPTEGPRHLIKQKG